MSMTDEELDALDAALASQIGDDVSVTFNHEALFKRSRAAIAALRVERDAAEGRALAAETAALELASKTLQDVAENWDCGHDPRGCRCSEAAEQWGLASDEIHALITTAARTALDAALADARKAGKLEGLMEAAKMMVPHEKADQQCRAVITVAKHSILAIAARVEGGDA